MFQDISYWSYIPVTVTGCIFLFIFLEIEGINLGQENFVQPSDALLWRKSFQGVSFSLRRSHWYSECSVIRYCFSSSGIRTSSTTNIGQMVHFILLLFSIKLNTTQPWAHFLNLAGLGCNITWWYGLCFPCQQSLELWLIRVIQAFERVSTGAKLKRLKHARF